MNNRFKISKLLEVAKKKNNNVDVNTLNYIIENEIIDNDKCKNNKRLNARFFTRVNGKFHRIKLKENGSFNGAIAQCDGNKIVCVFRSDEQRFVACYLDQNYNVIKDSYYDLDMKNCADPRILWNEKDQLILFYASIDEVGFEKEHIRGCVIMDNRNNGNFVNSSSFRVSPHELEGRQKNWMPFNYNDKIYLIASVCPHIIYELQDGENCNKICHTEWKSPWLIKEPLRGNTNAVLLPDGNYLATFHTSVHHNNIRHYDNGCYLFSGKPPFNVLKCANRTYLPAEAACEKHFRRENEIVCNFPLGMIYEKNKVIISYGDNDSSVKIAEYGLQDLLNTMVSVL
jgi:predicted GH43/DUF377 family glycosyl hydrolase